MPNMHSLRYRIMGMTFLLIILTTFGIVQLANWQMETLFQEYLALQPGIAESSQTLGASEQSFLHSVHHSLLWFGLLFAFIGLVVSFLWSRGITTPLYELSRAADRIRQGNLHQQVDISSSDEVGQLGMVFNQMSERLANNEQLRREFLANMAHELRTPLAILHSHLENMLEGISPASPEKLFSMQEEVMRLTRLVCDLRDLSLAEVRQLDLHKNETNLNLLLRRATDMLTPLLEEKQLCFDLELDENLTSLWLDADRMNQVFYNLISNAIRYTYPNTTIHIKTYQDERNVFVEIADEGPGIAPTDLPYIFDHFYRGEKSRSRLGGGSGIGLALAKQFVEIHDGSIKAENLPDNGTVMVIKLPVMDN
ncbi:sensor histidine kinase [Anaerovibrio sp.]|uniref:sensor histidine kinase n=1 Tax=Anaerovibrio sp. TaxID=1872532 RepID=UPI00388D51C5